MNKKECFVICPISNEGTAIRMASDYVLNTIINPALSSDYNIDRSDKIPDPNKINSQIMRHIIESDLVIADLRGLNPNVMYELGIRHALLKPTILIIDSATTLPFDIAQNKTIFYSFDEGSAYKYVTAIREALLALEKDSDCFETDVLNVLKLNAIDLSSKAQENLLKSIKDNLDFLILSNLWENAHPGKFLSENVKKEIQDDILKTREHIQNYEKLVVDFEEKAKTNLPWKEKYLNKQNHEWALKEVNYYQKLDKHLNMIHKLIEAEKYPYESYIQYELFDEKTSIAIESEKSGYSFSKINPWRDVIIPEKE